MLQVMYRWVKQGATKPTLAQLLHPVLRPYLVRLFFVLVVEGDSQMREGIKLGEEIGNILTRLGIAYAPADLAGLHALLKEAGLIEWVWLGGEPHMYVVITSQPHRDLKMLKEADDPPPGRAVARVLDTLDGVYGTEAMSKFIEVLHSACEHSPTFLVILRDLLDRLPYPAVTSELPPVAKKLLARLDDPPA